MPTLRWDLRKKKTKLFTLPKFNDREGWMDALRNAKKYEVDQKIEHTRRHK